MFKTSGDVDKSGPNNNSLYNITTLKQLLQTGDNCTNIINNTSISYE